MDANERLETRFRAEVLMLLWGILTLFLAYDGAPKWTLYVAFAALLANLFEFIHMTVIGWRDVAARIRRVKESR